MESDEYNPKLKNILIKEQALEEIPALYQRLRLHGNPLLVYDKRTKEIAGDRIEELLSRSYDVHTVTITDADIENVENVKEKIREYKSGIVFGVGGGRSIDVAKLASYKAGRDFVSVPTNCSHDGITSERASIVSNGTKVSKKAHAPISLVADTVIIANAPHDNYTSGIADLVSNVVALADWRLARKAKGEEYNEKAAEHSFLAASYVIDRRDSLKELTPNSAAHVVAELRRSGIAMQIAGSSRPASGNCHKISHALDSMLEKPKLHGHQCGIGAIFSSYLHEKYNVPCQYSWEQIANALHTVGAPVTLKQLGVSREDFVKAVEKSPFITERYTIWNFIEEQGIDIDVEKILDEIGL